MVKQMTGSCEIPALYQSEIVSWRRIRGVPGSVVGADQLFWLLPLFFLKSIKVNVRFRFLPRTSFGIILIYYVIYYI